MNANETIKKLLTRLYMYHKAYPTPNAVEGKEGFDSGPLQSCFYPITEAGISLQETEPSEEWLNVALGGEAKALWDMVNESPYTPLETELLQRLQMACSNVYDLGTGDGKLVYRACFAPTEDAWLEPLSASFKDGPPWLAPGGAEEWAENKDQF